MSKVLHIPLLGFYEHDAIGNFTIGVADHCRKSGIDVRIYAPHHSSSLSVDGCYKDFFATVRPGDVLLYQLSNYEPELGRMLNLPCRKVIYYHNITPGHYFRPYHPDLADALDRARLDFRLMGNADAVFANSNYSLGEISPHLSQHVFRGVMPPVTPEILVKHQRSVGQPPNFGKYLLVAGRIVPHKNILAGLSFFAKLHEILPNFSLIIMGSDGGIPEYTDEVHVLASSLGQAASKIFFMGDLSEEEKERLFAYASALFCPSAHEGFGVPIVEAMSHGIGILAFDQPAIRETIGNAGLLLDGDNPDIETAARFLASGNKNFLMFQNKRLAAIQNEFIENVFWEWIDSSKRPKASCA